MKFIVFFILLFSSKLFAQTHNKFSTIESNLNSLLEENNVLRGLTYFGGFHVDSNGNIQLGYNSYFKSKDFDEKLIKVLEDNKLILPGGSYRVNVYWDKYSSSVYSSVLAYEIEEGFPNYTLLSPDPSGGLAKLIKNIRESIVTSLTVDSLVKNRYSYQLYSPIEIAVNKEGNGFFFKSHPLEAFIDSSIINRWSPALYYARLRNSVLAIQYTFHDLTTGKFDYIDVKCDKFYLDDLYQGNIIFFEEEPEEIPKGKSVVSFVLNASLNKFENPIVHRGIIPDGLELVKWIQQYDLKEIDFFWSNFPESKRIFFYY